MDYTSRLTSGLILLKTQGNNLYVRPFKAEDRVLAESIAEDIRFDCVLEGLMDSNDMNDFLIDRGWWSKEQDETINELMLNKEQMKLDYYNSFFKEDTKRYIKLNLKKLDSKLTQLISKKNAFFDKTIDYIAQHAKTLFLLERSVFVDNKTPIINVNINLISLMSKYSESLLGEDKIREIAKTGNWRTLWGCSKNFSGLFSVPVSDLNSEQVSLISWSSFYDNIRESPDCPSDAIIDDDTALDGWVVQQSRKREEEEKQREAEKLVPKNSDAGELMIPVRNEKEQERVLSLNSGFGKNALQSMRQDLKRKGSVKDKDLSHNRQAIQMEINKKGK